MGKNNQNLVQQIELPTNQNKLIEQMNSLIARRIIQHKNLLSEEFVENINRDEMRSGFLVTSHRKKLWNVEIGLINEFARVCKKYNLKWFAYGGTLLGAARHKGFIPWDDDIDLAMLRPDYEKFRKVAESELKQYYIDFWYRYKVESEGASLYQNDGLQIVDKNWEEEVYSRVSNWPFWPMIKIRDNQTSMIQWFTRKNMHQGIFIDIFPLDSVPPFYEKMDENNFELVKELFMATNYPRIIKKSLENNPQTIIERSELEKFVNLPFRERALIFEDFMSNSYFTSPYVGEIRNHTIIRPMSYKISDFDEIIYMPFEKIELPVPSGYDDILTAIYGDWHKMMVTHVHSAEWSVDIPYTEYYQKSGFVR